MANLNQTPSANRVRIGFFGRRNAGKSSLVNAVTGQNLSIVSDVKGTTTDPVYKSMELLPVGPVTIVDTPGLDDAGAVGDLRAQRARRTLTHVDVAVLVVDAAEGMTPEDEELLGQLQRRGVAHLVVFNKGDLPAAQPPLPGAMAVSAKTGENIQALKERIAALAQEEESGRRILGDLLAPGDRVVLVTPIDSSAPKGRMILPQMQAIRDILDADALCAVTQPNRLPDALAALREPPRMVVTDSQAFGIVKDMVPESVPLTSFSILFARYKGVLETAVRGVAALERLPSGSHILISEGCTHHRQCEDIGTVKLPGWIRGFTGRDFQFSFTSGGTFPDDLSPYGLVVHCGGCMLNEREMRYRQASAVEAGVPFTNYGTLIAHIHGILARSLSIFPDIAALLG